MIEQLNNAVDFYAFFVATKLGKTGLTVTVDVYRAGTLIITAASAVEVGDGLYRYTLPVGFTTIVGEYAGVFKTSDATVDQKWVPSLWVIGRAGVENLDVPVSTGSDPLLNAVPAAYAIGTAGYVIGLLGSAEVITLGPTLVDGGSLALVRGDDYLIQDARAISFESGDWPDLTGATVRMTMRRRREAFGSGSDPVIFEVPDVYSSRTSGTGQQIIVFELTNADTAGLIPGTATGKWDVQANLARNFSASPSPSPSAGPPTGDVITLAVGVATVVEDQTR